jgi:ureidoglycolate hydrolase
MNPEIFSNIGKILEHDSKSTTYLLPAKATINNLKRDKIPSVKLIEDRKEEIVRYWDLVQETHGERFQKEIQVTLLGQHPFSS